jgi:hypothetical protein
MMERIPGHSQYLDPKEPFECPIDGCEGGWIIGRDGEGRDTVPEKCVHPSHWTPEDRRGYVADVLYDRFKDDGL